MSFTWRMSQATIQSNVSVICVVMELAEDVRKVFKRPRFPGKSTAFSSPSYSSCQSVTLETFWGSSPFFADSCSALPRCVVHQEGLEAAFSFEGKLVSWWPNEWPHAEPSSLRGKKSSGAKVKTPLVRRPGSNSSSLIQAAQKHKPLSFASWFPSASHVELPAIHALKQKKRFPFPLKIPG